MIEFFRDVLDGPLYIVITVLSIIFIMAIIGFLMERKKIEKEAKSKIAVIPTAPNVTPIEPVTVQPDKEPQSVIQNIETPISNMVEEENFSNEVKPPIIVFEDPDEKKE